MTLTCNSCGTILNIPGVYVGKTGRCANCGAAITVPAQVPSESPKEAPSTPPRNATLAMLETLHIDQNKRIMGAPSTDKHSPYESADSSFDWAPPPSSLMGRSTGQSSAKSSLGLSYATGEVLIAAASFFYFVWGRGRLPSPGEACAIGIIAGIIGFPLIPLVRVIGSGHVILLGLFAVALCLFYLVAFVFPYEFAFQSQAGALVAKRAIFIMIGSVLALGLIAAIIFWRAMS